MGSSSRGTDLLWHRRAERGSLPSDIAELPPNGQPGRDAVNDFLDRLTELALTVWLSIGRELSESGSLPVRQLARADVDTAIAERALAIAAWHVRDAIETAACLASHQTWRWSRADRCLFASTHGAAEAAALALLAFQHIPAESLRALCAPFAIHLEIPQL